MGNKYYLKTFNNKAEYESQKNSVMNTPHVVLLNDTEEVIYASENYFTITALDDGYLTLTAPEESGSFKYRKNKGNWKESEGEYGIDVEPGDTVQISCESNSFKYSTTNTLLSSSNVRFDVSGNIMSLIYGDNFIEQTTLKSTNCFAYLLCNSNVVSAKNLILPATTLTSSCYESMFEGCNSLTTAPELPATRLAGSCYRYMFYGCSSLTTAPEVLPATALTWYCYESMFYGCSSLTTAPALPATILAGNCYYEMFSGCTSLTTAPALPATTLAEHCYYEMFSGCSSLTVAPALPATTLTDYCYYYMFNGCSSLTTPPALTAATLTEGCYQGMFYNCNSLDHITMSATDISASNCLSNWLYGVASSGFICIDKNMTSLPNGDSGVPLGWTIIKSV